MWKSSWCSWKWFDVVQILRCMQVLMRGLQIVQPKHWSDNFGTLAVRWSLFSTKTMDEDKSISAQKMLQIDMAQYLGSSLFKLDVSILSELQSQSQVLHQEKLNLIFWRIEPPRRSKSAALEEASESSFMCLSTLSLWQTCFKINFSFLINSKSAFKISLI